MLFNLKPEEFIEGVSSFFFGRQTNVSEKVWLMALIEKGIEQLATTQPEEQQSVEPEFYFKKVKSRYFVEPEGKERGEETHRQE